MTYDEEDVVSWKDVEEKLVRFDREVRKYNRIVRLWKNRSYVRTIRRIGIIRAICRKLGRLLRK